MVILLLKRVKSRGVFILGFGAEGGGGLSCPQAPVVSIKTGIKLYDKERIRTILNNLIQPFTY